MQYEILFGDGDGATRLVEVALTPEEIRAAAEHHHPDLCAQCYALTRAYKQVPSDWYHYSDRIKQIVLQ
jgi:hypothetical protein